jgi:Flp pilus assembly CpaF family ATPase
VDVAREVMVNGPDDVYVERKGLITMSGIASTAPVARAAAQAARQIERAF